MSAAYGLRYKGSFFLLTPILLYPIKRRQFSKMLAAPKMFVRRRIAGPPPIAARLIGECECHRCKVFPAGYAYDSYTEYAGSSYYVAETTNRTPIAYTFADKPSYTYRVI